MKTLLLLVLLALVNIAYANENLSINIVKYDIKKARANMSCKLRYKAHTRDIIKIRDMQRQVEKMGYSTYVSKLHEDSLIFRINVC